ncbi:3-oxoacyl-ACP synthase [Streptomyces avermitilis]|uniref:3-oxoacyl-ACP synthase III n=2 Tax=Streptomyces avermitilis TaxID=33903 RepID=Q82NC9_STRAW|nr:ketoacyl-ACP synthase III family protein [Streptomyces avermitilis]MYS97003.1 3-oxoacyl-ACP synthase [Streptomyces sp. SID5469]KUN55200.1 3-oxoacyl-ACP synthase [Streptomyces avermitilis]OOV26694.1 3-oxoacyl-ACP synthase [Streptomyces avermitilis]BAC69084.1 putative 3-oxoacyl-ACP synthase III [Streptomyces avermitilis MA-4680 = NBRC 14893]BBJ49026.1 3-oxoacyl-ACP synthase [Streptomyces avermitilis]
MTTVSLTDVASYLPGEPVPAEFYTDYPGAEDKLRNHPMFKVPPSRHHVAADESNADMVERAVQPLIERHGRDEIRGVDVLLVHSQLPDLPFVGAGTEVARRLGLNPEWLVDVANAGCASFVYMLKLARQILTTTDAKTALICNAQSAAGQCFTQSEVRRLAQAAIPGDGCGVGYVTTSADTPVLDVETRHIGEYAGDMTVAVDDGRKYWEPGESQLRIGFTDASVAKVLARGNRLVPEVVTDLCRRLGVATADIDVLITNQPNRTFLRNWREALQLPPERHLNTFDQYGNLFGAAIPITLDRAIRSRQVEDGDLVVLGGFAHAGDFAGATAVRWHGGRG